MDNYEQKYKEALLKAKKVHDGELTISPNEVNDFNVYEYIFHELKEYEDERIRKALLELVRQSSEVLDKQNQNNIVYQIGSAEIAPTDIQYKVVSDRVYIPNIKLGDKAKIIIIKPEQQ